MDQQTKNILLQLAQLVTKIAEEVTDPTYARLYWSEASRLVGDIECIEVDS